MRLAVYIFAGLGAWCVACFFAVGVYAMLVDLWRNRAAETTRPGAPPVRDTAHALGLVATPSQPGTARRHSPGTPPNPAGKQP